MIGFNEWAGILPAGFAFGYYSMGAVINYLGKKVSKNEQVRI